VHDDAKSAPETAKSAGLPALGRKTTIFIVPVFSFGVNRESWVLGGRGDSHFGNLMRCEPNGCAVLARYRVAGSGYRVTPTRGGVGFEGFDFSAGRGRGVKGGVEPPHSIKRLALFGVAIGEGTCAPGAARFSKRESTKEAGAACRGGCGGILHNAPNSGDANSGGIR